jgi:polyhydroxybutyrate depolymerase
MGSLGRFSNHPAMNREREARARIIASRGLALIAVAAFLEPAETFAAASPGCQPAQVRDGGAVTVSAAGHERRALVRVPQSYDGKTPRPLVIAFHGFGQDLRNAEVMFAVESAWPDAIAVYPEGLERPYPDFPGDRGADFHGAVARGWQVKPKELGDRDLFFFDALRDAVLRKYCADPARLYLLGFSNGAYFANLIGCLRPDAVEGIAAAGGGLRCEPSKPLAVILFHGTNDPIVRFEESLDAARAWGRRDGCEASPDGAALGCVPRKHCENGRVVLCADGGSHHYEPSFTERAAEFFRPRPN